MNHETTVFFPIGADTLFGILANPESSTVPDLALVVLCEPTPAGMSGQNAVIPRLARSSTTAGLVSFRFDYRGVAASEGPPPSMRRDRPFVDEVEAAMDWLGARGVRRFVLAGSCFGAMTALATAAARADVCGVALLSCPIAADDLDPSLTPSSQVIENVGELTARGVPTLFCYGSVDASYAEFATARQFSPLGQYVATGCVTIEVLPGRLHSFRDVDLQDQAITLVAHWLGALVEAA